MTVEHAFRARPALPPRDVLVVEGVDGKGRDCRRAGVEPTLEPSRIVGGLPTRGRQPVPVLLPPHPRPRRHNLDGDTLKEGHLRLPELHRLRLAVAGVASAPILGHKLDGPPVIGREVVVDPGQEGVLEGVGVDRKVFHQRVAVPDVRERDASQSVGRRVATEQSGFRHRQGLRRFQVRRQDRAVQGSSLRRRGVPGMPPGATITVSKALQALVKQWRLVGRRMGVPCLDGTVEVDDRKHGQGRRKGQRAPEDDAVRLPGPPFRPPGSQRAVHRRRVGTHS